MSWWPGHARPAVPFGTLVGTWPRRRVALPLDQLTTHVHCIGLSGSGKSTFLAHLYLSLLEHGQAATLLDPHGDLARAILAELVARGWYRTPAGYQRLLYLDFAAAEAQGRFLPLGLLSRAAPAHRIAADVLDALHRAFPETAQAPIFDTLLPDVVTLLVENGRPLTDVRRVLLEKPFRDALLTRTADEEIVRFFHGSYDRLRPDAQVDYAGSVLRRARLLTRLPVLKHSLAFPHAAIDFGRILAEQHSLLVDLSGLEQEAALLLGCLLTVSAEQAAKARGRLPPDQRSPHWLIVDECQLFVAQSEAAFADMLSQTRKFGVFGVFSHQNFGQASERLRIALQNVGLEIAFALGSEDAKRAAPTVGRVTPKTVRRTVDAGASESAGMAEQWEAWRQLLEDLPPGQAVVRRRGAPALQVATPKPLTTQVDPVALAAVEQHYRETLFAPPPPPPTASAVPPATPWTRQTVPDDEAA